MMILYAVIDLEKLDHWQNTEIRNGKIRGPRKTMQQEKKKFASAIKLCPADRCVSMLPGIQEHGMCSAKPWKGVSHWKWAGLIVNIFMHVAEKGKNKIKWRSVNCL